MSGAKSGCRDGDIGRGKGGGGGEGAKEDGSGD